MATLTASSQATAHYAPLASERCGGASSSSRAANEETTSDSVIDFTILAQRYEADTSAMSPWAAPFPATKSLLPRPRACGSTADSSALGSLELAATLRELVAHHTKLATRQPSDSPNSAERFERSAGAPAPSDATDASAGEAKPTSDHRALADYFTSLAARYEQDTKKHRLRRVVEGQRFEEPQPSGLTRRWTDGPGSSARSAVEAGAAAALHKQQAATTR